VSQPIIFPTAKDSVPVADAVATVDESGRNWAVALINRHPDKTLNCTVKLKDHLLDGSYSSIVLAGDSPDAFNDIEHPNRVVPEKRAARSSKV
jgi:alpha-L-arabinofuranosidase